MVVRYISIKWTFVAGVLLGAATALPAVGNCASLLSPNTMTMKTVGPNSDFTSPLDTPDSALVLVLGLIKTSSTLTSTQDQSLSAMLSDTVTDETTLEPDEDGPRTLADKTKSGGTHAACQANRLAIVLQADTGRWNTQDNIAVPGPSQPEFVTAGSVGSAERLVGPFLRSIDEQFRLSQSGPAGGWCRPRPLPFDESSPLASRAVFLEVVIVLAVFIVFVLSRGLRVRHSF